PAEVTIVPLFQVFRRLGLVNTHWPLILVPIFGAPSVFATFVMRQFFIALPVELEEAARVDGLGRFTIFRKIALPLARPALASVERAARGRHADRTAGADRFCRGSKAVRRRARVHRTQRIEGKWPKFSFPACARVSAART